MTPEFSAAPMRTRHSPSAPAESAVRDGLGAAVRTGRAGGPSEGTGLEDLLLRLERERRTGEVSCGLEGRVLLSEGLVCRAESRRATPLTALRTADGPIEEQPWWPERGGRSAATGAGGDDAPSPLGIYVLAATFDALALLLDSVRSAARPGGADGGTDGLDSPGGGGPPRNQAEGTAEGAGEGSGAPGGGPVFAAGRLGRRTMRCTGVPPGVLLHECARRAGPVDGWPLALADVAPVVAARRTRRQRVMLTAVQVEVALAADGRRTPAAVAAELGRPVVVCLEAVRALTALGLVERPAPADAASPRRRRRAGVRAVRPSQEPPVDLETLLRLRAALEQV
ncbi:hypothetical protein [Actinomadura gamaensis]|uniref:MarR family transcriptional regulator n=1 Tax=Actinomadura gamaensis TaxID=1763541 RepID=A0ABV9TTL8_9ACTN